VLISAPQKGWSGPLLRRPGDAQRARPRAIDDTTSSSFACDLKKWLQIMETYEKRRPRLPRHHAHRRAARLRDAMRETEAYGFDVARAPRRWNSGARCARCSPAAAFPASPARASRRPAWWSATPPTPRSSRRKKFVALGLQTAAGVPLQCDEPADFRSFRIGLFGLDKLATSSAPWRR
jgi:aspartate aminotransferase-like enzyme